MARPPDVFLSHGPDTRPLAEQLVKALDEGGLRSWASFKDLRPGQRFTDELERAATGASSFLILVDPEGKPSSWQDAEWRAAFSAVWMDEHKRLIPLIVGNAAVSEELGRRQSGSVRGCRFVDKPGVESAAVACPRSGDFQAGAAPPPGASR
jgi:hypothetical protein